MNAVGGVRDRVVALNPIVVADNTNAGGTVAGRDHVAQDAVRSDNKSVAGIAARLHIGDQRVGRVLGVDCVAAPVGHCAVGDRDIFPSRRDDDRGDAAVAGHGETVEIDRDIVGGNSDTALGGRTRQVPGQVIRTGARDDK